MMRRFVMSACLVTVALVAIAGPAIAQSHEHCADCLTWKSPLVIVQIIWMLLVTVGAVLYSWSISKSKRNVVNEKELRGLNLPRGSLRGILALATIGSFVNVMVLGAPALGESFDSVLAAFGTLTGSIIGFYFGTRGATPSPNSPGAVTEQSPRVEESQSSPPAA